ncbi:MAG: glutamyl-tRNA reductase [Planctomycetota bacterium]
MPIPFVCISRDHTNTPVAIRERLTVPADAIVGLLQALRDDDGAEEAVLACTCNRTELYLAGPEDPDPDGALARLAALFDPALWARDATAVFRGADAVRRLYRVAAGMESRVLGESQILGQIKTAYSLACEAGANGFYTNELFHRAFRLGKTVRSATGFSTGGTSVGTVAVDDAAERFGPLAGKTVLVVGAGEIARLVLRALAAHRPGRVLLANRGRHGAAALARTLDAEPLGLDALPAALGDADLVFSATASPAPVLRRADLPDRTADRPLAIYDLALPRDAEPALAEAPHVTLVDLDAIGEHVETHLDERAAQVPAVERLVEDALAGTLAWHEELAAVPSIRRLLKNARTEAVRLHRLLRDRLPDAEAPAIEREVRRITQRFLHAAVTELKETARHASERTADREERRARRTRAERTP